MATALTTRPALPPVGSQIRTIAATAVLATGAAAVIVLRPDLLRVLCALAIVGTLVTLVLGRPRAGVVATLAFLVVLALLRRLLIADAGWGGPDPLVLVGPVVATGLTIRLFVLERRAVAPDGLSKLVLLVLALTVAQVANPFGGGPLAGLAGLLGIGVPLLWFFVGRELADDRLVGGLLALVVALGAAVAVYGLWQTENGFPAWDQAWLLATGYDALNVGDDVRAFGTFASSAEYALFLGSALAVAAGLALRRHPVVLLLVPVLAVALFLASARGALVTTVVCVVVLGALSTGRAKTALAITLAALVLGVGALAALGPALTSSANNSGSDLVSHQVGGVTDPLDPSDSTLLIHVGMVVEGVGRGIAQPLGSGPGSVNQFGGAFGAEAAATEVDLSNAFVALGLVGGFAYLALVLALLRSAITLALSGHRLMLPVLGVLLVGLGQWLIGGHYALAPITWLLLGYVAREASAARRPLVFPPLAPRAAHPHHGPLPQERR